ncbi:hypothetical protein ACEPAH_7619 [Sanghuangporus vaninii]
MASRLKLSNENATSILRAHDGEFGELVRLEKWDNLNTSVKIYTAIYSQTSTSSSNHNKKAIITIASTAQSLDTIEALHKTIRTHTSIPLPALLKRDVTTSLIAHPYSLYSHPSGVSLTDLYPKSSPLSVDTKPHSDRDPDKALFLLKTELKLGSLTKILHESVQNDWFGLPGEDAENKKEWGECYSWQEGFTILLENALEEAEGLLKKASSKVPGLESEGVAGADNDHGIPTQDIHRLLSRAIGSFLFDDVEVPSLIFHPCPSVSGWLSRIFVSDKITNPTANTEEPEIAGLLGWESCIWGDPLLEGCFASSINGNHTNQEREGEGEGRKLEWPSKAFLKGYGSTPIVLPRHRTKRLWYDLYVTLKALVVFLIEDSDGDAENDNGGRKNGVVKEKVEGIKEVVRKLENAPCY